jgi:hypothetical protein
VTMDLSSPPPPSLRLAEHTPGVDQVSSYFYFHLRIQCVTQRRQYIQLQFPNICTSMCTEPTNQHFLHIFPHLFTFAVYRLVYKCTFCTPFCFLCPCVCLSSLVCLSLSLWLLLSPFVVVFLPTFLRPVISNLSTTFLTLLFLHF